MIAMEDKLYWEKERDGHWWALRLCEIFKYDLGILKYEDMTTNGTKMDTVSY